MVQRGNKYIHSSTTHYKRHNGPYLCNVCGEKFEWKYAYTLHYKQHTVNKSVLCEVCGVMFADKKSFNKHYRLHYGERQFRRMMLAVQHIF